MSHVWVICGAASGVGKTRLALKLCELLPGSTYAKCGHGTSKAGKPDNFFRTKAELDQFVAQSSETAEHVVVESNSWALTAETDVIVFIDGVPKRARVREDADALRRTAHVQVCADSKRAEWSDVLRQTLPDEELRAAVCDLLAEQQGYLAGRQPAVRTKVWLETSGGRVFGNGLARLLEYVQVAGTLGGAAAEAGLSYRYAWNLIRSAEKQLGKQLVIRHTGGAHGGSSELSEQGRRMLSLFQMLSHDVAAYADRRLAELYKMDMNREA